MYAKFDFTLKQGNKKIKASQTNDDYKLSLINHNNNLTMLLKLSSKFLNSN